MAKKKKASSRAASKKKAPKKRAAKRASPRGKKAKKNTSKKASKKKASKKKPLKKTTKKASKKKAPATRKKTAQKKTSKKASKATRKKAPKKASKKKASKKKTVAEKATKTRGAKTPQAASKSARPVSPPKGAGASRLGVGDHAPSFELPDQNGDRVSSAELSGMPYVLYFYPKDDTPGCTREACGFRDDLASFNRLGVRIIGVSPDSVASHKRFEQKYGLTFTLLSDADRTLASAYGVYVLKKNYGREYMGIERSTFVVDERGVIANVWRGVKVDGHVDKVRAAVSLLDDRT